MVKGWHGAMGGSRFESQGGPKNEKKEKAFTYQKVLVMLKAQIGIHLETSILLSLLC